MGAEPRGDAAHADVSHIECGCEWCGGVGVYLCQIMCAGDKGPIHPTCQERVPWVREHVDQQAEHVLPFQILTSQRPGRGVQRLLDGAGGHRGRRGAVGVGRDHPGHVLLPQGAGLRAAVAGPAGPAGRGAVQGAVRADGGDDRLGSVGAGGGPGEPRGPAEPDGQ